MRAFFLFVGLVSGCGLGMGQALPGAGALKIRVGTAPVAIPAATVATLQSMGARASVIFAGHVLSVDRQDAAGYVDVTFGIDQAVRGCGSFNQYVLREWAGLWSGEPDRYRVGARLLMLLPARSASGLSEPVGGMMGAIPLVGARTPPLTHGTGVAPADTGAGADWTVDLRWVQAGSARAGAAGSPGRVRPELEWAPAGGGWTGPVAAMPVLGMGASAPGLSAVLGLLGAGGGQ